MTATASAAGIAAVAVLLLTAAAPAPAVPTAPDSVLTLAEAEARALAAAPALQAAAARVTAQGHRADQAGRPPNFDLEVEWENLAGTGDLAGLDTSELTVGLGWTLELGGKRPARVELARREQDLAAASARQQRLELQVRVRRAYRAVQAAQERVDLLREQTALDGSVVEEEVRRVAAGAASPVELTRARVALASSRAAAVRAGSDLAAARRELAATWGAAGAEFARVAGRPEQVAPPPPLDSLLIRVAASPELMVAEAAVTAGRAAVAAEARAYRPDLGLGLGVRFVNDTGDRGLVLAGSLPLTLLNSGEDARQAARAELLAREHDREAVRIRLAAAVAGAWERLAGLHAEITVLEDEVLPGARHAFVQAREAHTRGRFSLTDVLATRSELLAQELRHLDVLQQYHETAAQLALLTGRPAALDPTLEEAP